MMRTTVWSEVTAAGYHCWPSALSGRAYLRDKHRHLFVVRVEVEVRHDDRDIEFHDLADYMHAWLCAGPGDEPKDWGHLSCEAIGKALVACMLEDGVIPSDRWLRVGVSEDGQAGAVTEWTP